MLKILIIDDELELIELYSDILSSTDRKIMTRTSGDQAIELLKTEKFDLILSDKKMGKTSGLDVLEFVENNFPETIFYLITGDSPGEVKFLNAQSKLIRKPFSFQELNSSIACIKSPES